MSKIDNSVSDAFCIYSVDFKHDCRNPATGLRPATIDNLKALLASRLCIIERDHDIKLFAGRYIFTFNQLPNLTDKTTPL